MGVSTDGILFYGILLDELPDSFQEMLEDNEDDVGSVLEAICDGPIQWGYHCSDSEYMYYICTKQYSASRGFPETDLNLEIDPKWEMLLEDFFAKHGLEYSSPKWILASFWG